MNIWVERTKQMVNSLGYLDKLSEIYSFILGSDRPLNSSVRQQMVQLHQEGEGLELLKLLLKLRKKRLHPFPFEHPYVWLLSRKRPDLLSLNQEVGKRLGQVLLSMKMEDIIRGCERPADLNRVMGTMFHDWLKKHFPKQGCPFLSVSDFETHLEGIAFLDARNAEIQEYANKKLGCELERGRDFLSKADDKFVIGEARFLSTPGGSQKRDLGEALNFVKQKKGNAIRVAILDGVMWFYKGYLAEMSKLREDEHALSALLLQEFLESLR